MPQLVARGGWVGTTADVGGRVREGKPPKLWSNFGHGLKTPATGAVDFEGFASCRRPQKWGQAGETHVHDVVRSGTIWPIYWR